jgi:hypothetical protein
MLDSPGHLTLIEDGDGVPVVDEGGQLPQAVLCHQGQVVDADQPTFFYIIKKQRHCVIRFLIFDNKLYGDG